MRKKTKTHNLTFTLALAFLALSAAVLFVSNSLQIYFRLKAQTNIIAARQLLIAKDAANMVKGFLDEKANTLKAASYVYPSGQNTETYQLLLEKLIGFEPAFRQIILFDPNGSELTRSSRLSKLLSEQLISHINTIKPEMCAVAAQGKSYFGPVYIDKITSEPMIIIAVTIKNALGDIKGMIAAEVNLKFMWDLVGSMKVGENGLAYVVDQEGRLIAHRDIDRVLKGETPAEAIALFGRSPRGGTTTRSAYLSKDINGIWVSRTFVKLDTPKWAVIVETPAVETYAPIADSLQHSLWTTIVSLVLAIAAGIYLAKKITRPIIQLKDAAQKIGEGDLNTRIKIDIQNEIGQLAASLNQMAENLDRITVSRDALKEEMQLRSIAQRELQQTAQKLTETNQELNETADKLASTNKELRNFVYIASHDLREPLRTISSFGALLEKSLKGKLDADDAQSLHYMIDGAKRMGQMIEGLLSYSRISTKGNEFEKVALDDIVSELKQYELNVLLRETNTIINVPQALPTVYADPIQIRQLFQNLISNGIKYQPKGNRPEITITSRPDAGNMFRIEITDNGIGIAPEYHAAIFAMFKRLHNKREYEGAGIGLAVCQKIVLRHNGKIGVESQPGKGATFWFTLPAEKSEENINTNTQLTEKI
jgi:signal transduction histidine kinase